MKLINEKHFIAVTDFASLNEVVDFFEIYTIFINQCRADVHNNIMPLKSNGCGREYQLGMVK